MDTLKKFSKTLLLFFLLFLISVDVAGASGQDSINELIKNGGNVNLSGTYTLTGPITLSSDLKLNGQNLTTITIPDDANWSVWVPLMKGEGLHNISIEGVEFNANADGNDETPHGRGYYNCIHLINCTNVAVRNCIFQDGKGDGLRAKYCKNVKFYNNTAYKLGHDCFYAIDSEGVLAWNNNLTTRTNCALRLWNSKDAKFFCNRINAQLDSLGGNPGIQIEDSKGTMDDISVFANTIYETWGPGIWLVSYDEGSNNFQNITIGYNRILKAGVSYNIAYTSGITIDGVLGTNVSNNVFDGCYNAGILVLNGGQDTKIERNIITDTSEHPAISQSGTGFGIDDRQSAKLDILNNCFFNNTNGNVYGAESTGDDLQDPTAHNTSSGWRWDGSKWLCDFVITLENITIDNSTFEYSEFDNETNYTYANDTDLHEIEYVPVNNTCTSKNVTVCNKSISRCQNICDVPLIASIIGCANKTKTNSCTSTCGNRSNTSTCGELQYKLVVIDNSQSENESNYNSNNSASASSDMNTSTESQDQNTNSSMNGSGSNGTGTLNSSKTNISNISSSSGNNNVTQTVANQNDTLTASTQITANANSALTPAVADFTAAPVSGSAPLAVKFTDASTGASAYAWDFGDKIGTSTEKNPNYVFTKAGNYEVVLIVSDGKGHSASKHMLITVTQTPSTTPAQLIADFYADSINGVDPLTVHFTDKSTGAVNWQWNFGDNSPVVTTKNSEHTFKVGTWNVDLKISDGTNIASKTMVITATEKPKQPTADFIVDRISGESPLIVQFSDKSSNAVSYEWNFGDGENSTNKSPNHTYSSEGNYYVILTVTGINGDKSASSAIITVSKPQNSKTTVDLNSNSTPLNSS